MVKEHEVYRSDLIYYAKHTRIQAPDGTQYETDNLRRFCEMVVKYGLVEDPNPGHKFPLFHRMYHGLSASWRANRPWCHWRILERKLIRDYARENKKTLKLVPFVPFNDEPSPAGPLWGQ